MGINIEFDWPKAMTSVIPSAHHCRGTQADHTSQAISELIDMRAGQSGTNRIDVLQHMLDNGQRPDTGAWMTNQDIIDQMSEILLAGSETTSGSYFARAGGERS
jgi:cytochrome P450